MNGKLEGATTGVGSVFVRLEIRKIQTQADGLEMRSVTAVMA
jgi:hypothetical protein